MSARFKSFGEFYPFCLSEHRDRTCRRLHFAGLLLALACIAIAGSSRNAWSLAAAPLAGYGCAWIWHFFFEHNRPATFTCKILASLPGSGKVLVDIAAAGVNVTAVLSGPKRGRSATRSTACATFPGSL